MVDGAFLPTSPTFHGFEESGRRVNQPEACEDTRRGPHAAGSRYDACASCSQYTRRTAVPYSLAPTQRCSGRNLDR
jgi:hypothetical protein